MSFSITKTKNGYIVVVGEQASRIANNDIWVFETFKQVLNFIESRKEEFGL